MANMTWFAFGVYFGPGNLGEALGFAESVWTTFEPFEFPVNASVAGTASYFGSGQSAPIPHGIKLRFTSPAPTNVSYTQQAETL